LRADAIERGGLIAGLDESAAVGEHRGYAAAASRAASKARH
jgi:hypothetical protein